VRWKYLITGAGGQLGSVLAVRLHDAGKRVVGVVSAAGPRPPRCHVHPLDLCRADATSDWVRSARPACIIHTAAITNVNACHSDPADARANNVDATLRLVELAAERRARFVFTSTDLVFDGRRGGYEESDEAAPLSVYGRTKLEAEKIVRGYERGAVVRLPLMYGLPAVDRPTTFRSQLDALRRGAELRLFHDECRSPLWLDDAVDALDAVARSDYVGLLHAGGPQRLSRLEMGLLAARALGVSERNIVSISQGEMPTDEPRPPDVSLSSARFRAVLGREPGRPMSEALPRIAAVFLRERPVAPS